MFTSFLLPAVCRRAHVLFTLFVLSAHSGIQQILCCIFCFVCLFLVSYVPNVTGFSGFSIIDCPLGFSNVYLLLLKKIGKGCTGISAVLM
jgi:hypothetical protein